MGKISAPRRTRQSWKPSGIALSCALCALPWRIPSRSSLPSSAHSARTWQRDCSAPTGPRCRAGVPEKNLWELRGRRIVDLQDVLIRLLRIYDRHAAAMWPVASESSWSEHGPLIRLISDDLFEMAAIGPIEGPRCAGRVRGNRRTIGHSLPFLGATLALRVGFDPWPLVESAS